jgi:ketosteroid isomerase-like protein
MKKLIASGAMLVVVGVVVACAPVPEVVEEEAPAPAMSPMEIFVELAKRWDAGMSSADVDAVLALYTAEGSAVMPPDQPEVTGAEGMRSFFEEFFSAGDATVTNVVEAVIAEGDLLAGKGSYTVELTTDDGETATQSGNWLSVLAKQADGSYLTLRNIWNRDAPLPGAPEPPPIAASGPAASADVTCYDSPTALDQGFEASIEAGNTAALVAAHSADGSRIPPDMPEMAGHAEIAAYLASRVDPFSERAIDLTDIGEMSQGSLGFTHGNYAVDYTPADGSEHVTGQGKYMAISTQGDDGCWRLEWVLWNSGTPPA